MPKKSQTAAPERQFRLVDCKTDGAGIEGRRRWITNWSGYPYENQQETIRNLVLGDCVRLILQDPTDSAIGEAIYFRITQIDRYSRGQEKMPRKFHGTAMDTYRMYGVDEVKRYVQTGEEITFAPRNIIEIPKWHLPQ